MYKEKAIGVVIPAFNEENQIQKVLATIPEYVDWIIPVDDASSDRTCEVIEQCKRNDARIVLLRHTKNQGVGGAIASGYKWARDNSVDCAVVMAGDGQMDPGELPALLEPVVSGETDYAKGNRLFTGDAYRIIPKVRYFGNGFLSLMTKIASGYWHVADSQSGYTAINKKALATIDWDKMYKRYGQPNDLLVRLNIYNFKVADVPVKPIYNIGEKSGIKIRKVVFTIGWLLVKLFFWRMKEKYIIRDFHPLIFFYLLGCFFGAMTTILALWVFYHKFSMGFFPPTSSLAMFFSFMSASQFMLFAMWFDMESNKDLKNIPSTTDTKNHIVRQTIYDEKTLERSDR